MEKQELFTIPEAVINFLGLRAEDWLRSDDFGYETYYCFDGDPVAIAMERQLIADAQQVDSDYAVYLGGVKANNPFNAYRVFEVKFPKLAFYNWWMEDHRGLEAPKWFDDLLLDAGLQEVSVHVPNNVSNEVEIEIIEGLTVGELRSYLKENSPEYLPRLLAVLRAKQKIIKERDSKDADGLKMYGSPKNPLKTLAENLVIEELKKVGMLKVSNVDKQYVSRVLLKELNPPTGQGGTY